MTIVNFNPTRQKMSFERAAKTAVKTAREKHVIVRFVSGGKNYQVAPKTALQTVFWTRHCR
jgi:hypothetical protein